MPNSDSSSHAQPSPREFLTTQWSVVLAAGEAKGEEARRALGQLCEVYWLPLYVYARRRISDSETARDMTQAFFAELLEKNYVGTATQERGRFRAFLLTAFKHFLSKQWAKNRAQKRGGGRVPISLDFAKANSAFSFEPAEGLTAEQLYDQQWAITLLGQIMDRLKNEFDAAGKAKQLDVLRGYLVGDHAGTTYAEAAETLGMTEAATKQAAARIRRRYRQLLREEIAQTVEGSEAVEDEIRKLFTVLEL